MQARKKRSIFLLYAHTLPPSWFLDIRSPFLLLNLLSLNYHCVLFPSFLASLRDFLKGESTLMSSLLHFSHPLSSPTLCHLLSALLMVSSGLPFPQIQWHFQASFHSTPWLHLTPFIKLETLGFWVVMLRVLPLLRCSSSNWRFPFHWCRFAQGPSLGPCFIFTLLAPLNSSPAFNFSFLIVSRMLSTGSSICAPCSLSLPSPVFAKSFIAQKVLYLQCLTGAPLPSWPCFFHSALPSVWILALVLELRPQFLSL